MHIVHEHVCTTIKQKAQYSTLHSSQTLSSIKYNFPQNDTELYSVLREKLVKNSLSSVKCWMVTATVTDWNSCNIAKWNSCRYFHALRKRKTFIIFVIIVFSLASAILLTWLLLFLLILLLMWLLNAGGFQDIYGQFHICANRTVKCDFDYKCGKKLFYWCQ